MIEWVGLVYDLRAYILPCPRHDLLAFKALLCIGLFETLGGSLYGVLFLQFIILN